MSATTQQPSRVATAARGIGAFVIVLWALECVDAVLLSGRLDGWGVRPWDVEGLRGILFAPLLHAGWGHLVSNTVPLLVLGFALLLSGWRHALSATAVIWLVAGLGTWLLGGPGTVHLGASSLIFGWTAFLLVRGVFTRSPVQLLLGVAVLLLYGSLMWGVLPGRPGISWQGHLFGAVGGLLAAYRLRPAGRTGADPVH